MTKLKFKGKSNILKKTSSSISPIEFSLATKEAATCPIDTCGGGGSGSDGYLYKEVLVTSEELINPPTTPIGLANGIELLRFPPDLLQSVDWKAVIEFYPGSISYDYISGAPFFAFCESWKTSNSLDLSNISINFPMYWNNITMSYENSSLFAPLPTDPWYLELRWDPGIFLTGNGTMKVKLWYKVVNFG